MSSYYLNLYWDEPTTSRTYNSLLKEVSFNGQPSQDKSYITSKKPFSKKTKNGEEEKYVSVKMSFPISEDFGFGVSSSFGTQEEAMKNLNIGFLNKIFDLLNLMNQIGSLNGKTSDTKNWMNFQVWTGTEPFKMSFKLQLNTISDPFFDVYVPAMTLTNMSNLSAENDKDGNFSGNYKTPGINWANMKSIMENYKKGTDEKGDAPNRRPRPNATTNLESEDKKQDEQILNVISSSGKIIKRMTITTPSLKSAEPEGKQANLYGNADTEVIMLDIESLFIRTCKPTWSKHRTESGVPLYCDLDLEIESIFMSNDRMIIPKRNDVAQMRKGYGSRNRMNRSASTIFR